MQHANHFSADAKVMRIEPGPLRNIIRDKTGLLRFQTGKRGHELGKAA